ncbi:MAG: 2-hydroxyacyl-CoA dehydratase subunit D [Promethearchaeota archaeon]
MDLIYDSPVELYNELYEFLSEKKKQGKKIIAHFAHEFVPHELIDACDAVPLSLIFAGNDDLMQIGADYLNPTMCSYARSLIGIFKNKEKNRKFKFLDLIDGIILSDYCTANLLVAESISKNFNVKKIEFFIPYLQKEHHVKYYREQLEILALKISEITGTEITEQKLTDSIKKYNNFRKKLAKIYELDLNGTERLKIFQKAILMGPDGIDLDQLETIKKREMNEMKKKVILSGCPVFIGDDLIELIEEECGGTVVYNDTWVGNIIQLANSNIGPSEPKSAFDLLTEVFRNNRSSAHCVPYYIEEYGKRISKISEKTNVKAVIYHIIKFCDLIGYPRHDVKERLSSIGIQMLQLERDYNRGGRGQLITRIEAFLEMIEES